MLNEDFVITLRCWQDKLIRKVPSILMKALYRVKCNDKLHMTNW